MTPTIPDTALDAVLCFVDPERPWAFFTTAPLNEQRGDGWNKRYYEHNSGEPYEWSESDECERYDVYRIGFYGDFLKPGGDSQNYPHSVNAINAGAAAWLVTSQWSDEPIVAIPAGTTLRDFIGLIEKGGGTVYAPVTR